MRLIQVVLLGLIATLTVVYFSRLRTKLLDRVIVLCFAAASFYMLLDLEIAARVAAFVGVGRGVDVAFYFGFIVVAFMLLLLFSKLREIEHNMTELIRKIAVSNAEVGDTASAKVEPVSL